MKQRIGRVSIALCLCIILSANTARAGDAESRRAKAMEMADLVQQEGLIELTIDIMAENSPEANRDKLREFVSKHLDREVFIAGFVDIYVDTFTVEELDVLLALYSTPIGRSIAAKRLRANARIANTLVRIVRENIAKAAKE